MRSCTTLGATSEVPARIAEKSRSWVSRTHPFTRDHDRISSSLAVGADGGPMNGLEAVGCQSFNPAGRQVHVDE